MVCVLFIPMDRSAVIRTSKHRVCIPEISFCLTYVSVQVIKDEQDMEKIDLEKRNIHLTMSNFEIISWTNVANIGNIPNNEKYHNSHYVLRISNF